MKNTPEPKKDPWPCDAIMIVAANAGEEVNPDGHQCVKAACRDCGVSLHASPFTYRSAMNNPARYGRPVKYFCIPCAVRYDVNTIQDLNDQRGQGILP